jgi:putative transposase
MIILVRIFMHAPHLRRTERVFLEDPVYFVTTCTHQRISILNNPISHQIIDKVCRSAGDQFNWNIGTYMIMPDHLHIVVAPQNNTTINLNKFIGSIKQSISYQFKITDLKKEGPLWQHRFFDHIIRNDSSYEEKLQYILNNPMKSNLIEEGQHWPFQGIIKDLMYS